MAKARLDFDKERDSPDIIYTITSVKKKSESTTNTNEVKEKPKNTATRQKFMSMSIPLYV